jgi:tetratricopeptide (TPR) repeat protein
MESDWRRYYALAENAVRDGNYDYAETMWQAALQEAEEFGQADHRLALTYEGLGEVYWYQGKFRQAERPAKQALEIYQRLRGDDHLEVGMAAHNLAMVYHAQQRYGQAEPLYKIAMSIKTKALGAKDPDVMRLLDSYADLLQKTHREAEAAHLKSCIESTSSGRWSRTKSSMPLPEPEPAPVAAATAAAGVGAAVAQQPSKGSEPAVELKQESWEMYNASAERAYAVEDFTTALSLWNQALNIAENFSPEDARFVHSLDRIGEVLYKLEKYGQAEMAWGRSLQSKLRVLGGNHPAVAVTANNLAGLHYLLGRYSEAESYTKKCIEIYENGLGPDHPNVAICLHNLASLNHVQGKYQEAEPHYKRTLEIRNKTLGAEHPDTQRVSKHYADLLKTLGRNNEADNLSTRATGLISGVWKTIDIPESESLALVEPESGEQMSTTRSNYASCNFCGAIVKSEGKCTLCGMVQGSP